MPQLYHVIETRRVDIEENLRSYLGSREPTARYSSFDYCFNHFQRHRKNAFAELAAPGSMELSCLHLGYYLASWGMLRASPLLRRSVKQYTPVIEAIASMDLRVWDIDAHAYSDETIDVLMETLMRLRQTFPHRASDILVTKIMLGVFGCVPAFDRYFKQGFKVSTFGRKSLRKVGAFYRQHADVIERYRVPTLDFATGAETTISYPRSKVIDMIFFIEGAQ